MVRLKKPMFLFSLLFFATYASAHSGNGTAGCGLPAPWEVHTENTVLLFLGAMLAAGLISAYWGWRKKRKKRLLLGVIAITVSAVAFFLGPPYIPELGAFGNAGSAHEHADFAVFINGVQWNFSAEKYQSDEGFPKSGLVHLHGHVGTVLHKHATGVALSYFFKSVGWGLNDTCISTDENIAYCTSGKDKLGIFVNGIALREFSAYSPRDLDRIAIVYGDFPESELANFQSQVTNYACVYSGKCEAPAGFELPEESCAD